MFVTHDEVNYEVLSSLAQVMLFLFNDTSRSSSLIQRRNLVNRNHKVAHDRLMEVYFADYLVYDDEMLRRRL